MTRRIAVIGSGISGLSAAWLLSRPANNDDKAAKFDVVLYEKGSYVGGHTHTVDITSLDGAQKGCVDTGFIVCNPHTYPNFLNFLSQLDVPLLDSDMSFSVSKDKGAFEWAGDNLFAQKSNIFNPRIWKMIWDIIHFHQQAIDIVEAIDKDIFDDITGKLREEKFRNNITLTGRCNPCVLKNNLAMEFLLLCSNHIEHPYAKMSLAEFFKKFNYSTIFYESYIVPMTASIWSTPYNLALDQFPLITLVTFMRNHSLLQIYDKPKWKTVLKGSKTYVEAVLQIVKDVRLNTEVISIKRSKDPKSTQSKTITIHDVNGGDEKYDHVIFACHTDQALKILGSEASESEKKILGAIKYIQNRAVLHRDTSLMPLRRKAWSSWNYLQDTFKSNTVCLTYWMNRLQTFIKADVFGDVFVTMNPIWEPAKSSILGTWNYEHPFYCDDAIASQENLNSIQGRYCTTYCGAWTNYGFHEDGLTSGLLAALSLGISCPFSVVLNGGYPTHRHPPTPPEWVLAESEHIITPYKPIHIQNKACIKFNFITRPEFILSVIIIIIGLGIIRLVIK